MSPDEISLVRRSFLDALCDQDGFADTFYRRLFASAPALRALFPADMGAQRRKLMDTLVALVDMLDKPDKLEAAAVALGASHRAYGVTEKDFAPVGAALIWAFETRLGGRFGPAMRDAWAKLYAALSRLMIDGGRVSAAASR